MPRSRLTLAVLLLVALALLVAICLPVWAHAQVSYPPGGSGGTVGPPTTSVVIVRGDSQANGSADDQTAGGFANNGNIFINNAAQAWVAYNPGVAGGSGVNQGANTTGIGPELGVANAWMAAYPTAPLYIFKWAYSGSFQGIGPSLGTVTASITGNIVTPTVGTFAAQAAGGFVLTGTGLPAYPAPATYGVFAQTAPAYYVGTMNTFNGYTGGNVVAATMTFYNAFNSWSSQYGITYNGGLNGTNRNGFRYYAQGALAKLKNPKIVLDLVMLGTNDMSTTTTGAQFGVAATDGIARIRSDFPQMANAHSVYCRVRSTGTDATTVRTAMANLALADVLVNIIDMDAQPVSADNTHWRQAGLNYCGAQAFIAGVL